MNAPQIRAVILETLHRDGTQTMRQLQCALGPCVYSQQLADAVAALIEARQVEKAGGGRVKLREEAKG